MIVDPTKILINYKSTKTSRNIFIINKGKIKLQNK